MDKKNKNSDHQKQKHDEGYEVDEQPMPADDDEGGLAVLSLHRLESDIRKLQTKWNNVEGDLQERDAAIAELNAELELRQANLKSLHDELDTIDEEREKTNAEIKSAHDEVSALQERIEQKDAMLGERAHELEIAAKRVDDANAEREKVEEQVVSLKNELGDQRKITADANVKVMSNDLETRKLQSTIQDLEAYVDRRKGEWESLNAELDDYRNALVGMEKTVKSRESDIQDREEEKSALARSIIELEQQIAELDGRRAERQSMSDQLQALADQRGQEIEDLTAAVEAAKAETKPLNSKIETQEAHIASLLEEAGRQRDRISDLEKRLIEASDTAIKKQAELSTLAAEQEKIVEACRSEERAISGELRVERDDLMQKSVHLEAELEKESARAERLDAAHADAQAQFTESSAMTASLKKELDSEQHKFAELEKKYDEHQAESVELWSELKQSRESLAEAETRASLSEAKSAEFEAEATVFAEEIGTMRDDLIAKNQTIAQLESELTARKDTIALLDRNVQRLSDIGDHVQALDGMIARESGQERRGNKSIKQSGVAVPRLIVAMNGDQTIRFPLTKKRMTIGRSMESDIQLRWKCVSRNHARIVCGDSGATIEDLGSKNGIYVNDKPVRSFELHDGDRVEIGEVQFEYIDLEEQAAAAAHN